MSKNQKGIANNQLIVILASTTVIFLLVAVWAFMGKSNSDKNNGAKVASAVAQAKTDTQASVAAQYEAKIKSPTRTYKGSSTYGSVTFSYPKNWSALVDTSSQPINAYFFPEVLPAINTENAFALRVELVDTSYSDVLADFDSDITAGDVKSKAYVPPKMVGVTNSQPGVKLTGKINQEFQGTMVILKVRDKTLKVYTESKDYNDDLSETVLPSLSFVP